jgi:para-aminobenzoate synthetase component 2
MILMIDNYDSFTYNLVQYMGELGAELEVYRNDQISIEEIERQNPEKIVISPGPCTPSKAGISKEVIKHFAGKIPLLGVCLGHQSVVEAFGGEIIKAKKLMHGKTSMISHDEKTIFKGLPNQFEATRYHSLVVNRANLPDCFEITAESDDGEIMGVRHKELAVEGVQFHPESILTVHGKDLLKNFIDLPAEKVREHEGSGHPA